MNGTPVSFATNSLQTSWIITQEIKHESAGTKLAIPYTLSHANGSVIPYSEYSSKMITLQGTIVGSGVADLDAKLDTFRGYFALDGQFLDIGYAGGTRRYVATMLTLDIDRPGGLGYAKFTVTLLTLSGFGQDTTNSNLVASTTGITTSSRTDNVTVGGSAPWQLPVATVTLTAVSASGSQSMNFGNNNNGQQVTITRSGWASGDVVVFDSVNRIVTVNGAQFDYTGGFPELSPGSQSLGYSDSFTTRTFTYQVQYAPRWL